MKLLQAVYGFAVTTKMLATGRARSQKGGQVNLFFLL